MCEQNVTEYRPTTAEQKLLEVLLTPECRNISKTEVCKRAGISRQAYYKIFKKPAFVAYYEAQARDLVREAVGPVVNAFVQEAKKGSYPHGKVVLEMAGIYAESKNVNLNATLSTVAEELQRRREAATKGAET